MTALEAEHFRAIADFTYDWETWVGPSGEVRWVNPAVERLTGFAIAECLQMVDYPLPLVHEPDRAGVAQVLARAAAGESGNHYEFRVRRKDGTIAWAAISWQPLISASGAHLGYRSSVRDIDERKQLEARLEKALVAAEAASRAKSEFLANVSHELRTPLQSILGYAQLLAAAKLEPPLGRHVATLLEQGQLLDRLVGDLLDYSSLQAGLLPLRVQGYDPRTAAEQVVRACQPLAAEKGLTLELDAGSGPEHCLGDPVRVCQVVANLVGNAIKFSEHGSIRVSVGAGDAQGRYRITIDDSGPGMPEGESLFAPFRRGDTDAARRTGGVGLGLAIGRQLCERMGGSLASAASPLGGARFVITLPLESPGAVSAPVERFEAPTLAAPVDRAFARRHPLEVLVVDDVAPAREFMQAALAALGYDAAPASSAEQAFALAAARSYDLVLVDIQMPDIDGWSAARGLRERLGSRPFLVALSADARAGEPSRLHAAGFHEYAQKPLKLEQLQLLLCRAHARARGSSEHTPSNPFDAERWRELSEILVNGNETLLERMAARVSRALPDARLKLRSARGERELGRALHELHGLLALIGAADACACLARAEQATETGSLTPEAWSEIERHLEAVAGTLARVT